MIVGELQHTACPRRAQPACRTHRSYAPARKPVAAVAHRAHDRPALRLRLRNGERHVPPPLPSATNAGVAKAGSGVRCVSCGRLRRIRRRPGVGVPSGSGPRRRILRRVVCRRHRGVQMIRADHRLHGKIGEAERVAEKAERFAATDRSSGNAAVRRKRVLRCCRRRAG